MPSYPPLCRLPLAAGSKRPLLVRWSTIDPDDPAIAAVFAEQPNCNVGLRLDQFVVVDCDTPERARWWAEYGPETRFISMGNPEHRSFWYTIDPEDEARPSRRPGIDVKTGPGHQCVVPPSIHPSGRRYEWVLGKAPELGTGWTIMPPPIAGTTISALLDQIAPERGPVGDGSGWDVVMEGEGRDNFLIGAAGYLRAKGCSVVAVRQGIADWNESFCEPRLPSRDLDRIANSSGRWEAEAPLQMADEDIEAIDDAIERYASE
jgi:bifunctional DNA primase/polymerase-like protein/primase-like protein